MLKRLYVDNYKCLTNFEFAPGRTQLILGPNGAGKSSVFEVLLLLRRFINTGGIALGELLSRSSLTRWDKRSEQTFELDVEGPRGTYQYRLVVKYEGNVKPPRVSTELLQIEGQPLVRSIEGEVTLYTDTHGPAGTFGFNPHVSAFVALPEREKDDPHQWFRDWLGQMQLVRIDPFGMQARSDHEHARLAKDATNFASWYRHLIQDSPELIEEIRRSLADVWPGFRGLRLESAGADSKLMKVVSAAGANGEGSRYELSLDEISDGQRALLVLYTLLHHAKLPTCPLVGIDEPDNFVALEEIQPWIVSLCQAVEDAGSQAFIVSHHPALINYLAPQDAVILDRVDGGPTRVRPFRALPGSTLPPAEVIARGWDGE